MISSRPIRKDLGVGIAAAARQAYTSAAPHVKERRQPRGALLCAERR
jgi:hypothetical protein